ncbi:hypothetical protein ABMX48_08690 [Streptomyces cavourensis]
MRLARRVGDQDEPPPARRRHRQGGRPDPLAVEARRGLGPVRLVAEQQGAVREGAAEPVPGASGVRPSAPSASERAAPPGPGASTVTRVLIGARSGSRSPAVPGRVAVL